MRETDNREINKVNVQIFDQTYTVKGHKDDEYIRMIANYVDNKMNLISERNSRLGPHNVAVLAALNIADELAKLQKDYDSLVKLIDDNKEG